MTLAIPETQVNAVEAKDLGKQFRQSKPGRRAPWSRERRRTKSALGGVSLTVPAGRITGIIGANGSGKSTLIRILSTLLLPDQGDARIFGHDVVDDPMAVRKSINRVSVEAAFFKQMSPWENLSYSAHLYGTAEGDTRRRTEAIVKRLGLPFDALDRPMKQLSRGQQQKVAIARAFLTSPMLLLMDEPTTGLDPRSKREVQELVKVVREEHGATVLLSTHDLQEAELLCDEVLILDQGRILEQGTPAELRAKYSTPEHAATLEDVFMEVTGKSLEEDSEDEAEGTA